MTYRPEIDGLRALAVLAVMFYHADLIWLDASFVNGWFSGGFLGVDIFFVISGYLITAIILAEVRDGSFSYLDFYHRRARRLLPALLFVSFVTLLIGWQLMMPDAFIELAGSVLATTFFVSNVFFLMQDSYVAEAAAYKPFLHTWSLAVEEQFYLVYPTALLLLNRFIARFLLRTLVCIAAASLLLAAHWTLFQVDYSFYLLPSRIWELLAGAFLAVKAIDQTSSDPARISLLDNLFACLGLAFICVSIVLFDDSLAEPSFHTLLPVVGTVLVIWYGRQGSWVAGVLSTKPLVAIGLISYSLYLWHQPILVFARIYWFGQFHSVHASMALLTAVPIAYLSWRLIEVPARNRSEVKTPVFVRSLILGTAAVTLTATLAWQEIIVPSVDFLPEKGEIYPEFFGEPQAETSFLIVGDSHAAALGKSLDRLLKMENMRAKAMLQSGCPYFYSIYATNRGCRELNAARRELFLNTEIDNILVVARYVAPIERVPYINMRGDQDGEIEDTATFVSRFINEPVDDPDTLVGHLEKDLLELVKAGKKVFLVDPVPEMGINAFRLWRTSNFLDPPYKEPYQRYLDRSQRILTMNDRLAAQGAQLISTRDIFCDEQFCYNNRDGWVYYDDDHPSRLGADRIVSRIIATLKASP